MSEKRLLFTNEAAKHIGASVHVLRKYVAKGLVSAHKFGERLPKFDPAELDDAVKAIDPSCKIGVWRIHFATGS
jgi:hypothetical protein